MIPNCELPREEQIKLIKIALDYKGPTIRSASDENFYARLIEINRTGTIGKIYKPGELVRREIVHI